MNYQFVAPTLFGLEGLAGDELRRLGMENVKVEDRRVFFTGDENALAKANICLRTGERIMVVVARFKARTFEELFQGVLHANLEDYIPRDGQFPVKGHCLNSQLMSVSDCQAIIKKAASRRLGEKYGVSWLPETGVKFQMHFTILNDEVTLSIDTSGPGLHKRGYRAVGNDAPLHETLAAGMIQLTRYRGDEITESFLIAQGRGEDYVPLSSDPDAVYDRIIDIDLSSLKPMIACPHSPDNVVEVASLNKVKVDQVCIGSCTNSSLMDLLKVAAMLKGKTIHPSVSLSVSPGSRQVLTMLSDCGALSDILASGARVLECACGPCIGMGFSPNSGGVSLRTFNRNFLGRSGTKDGQVYLVSPETAVASALTGYITDPTTIGEPLNISMPEKFLINDSAVLSPIPEAEAADAEVLRGPNIKEFPKSKPFTDSLSARLVLKVGDNITTDHIMPAGAKILPYRSNIPYLSQFCFEVCDPSFADRAKAAGSGVIVGGSNYGQGSSREHAALVPMYLGIRCVIAKSFARIHAANLINAGILPLTFADPRDYDAIEPDTQLYIYNIEEGMKQGKLTVTDQIHGFHFTVNCDMTDRQRAIVMAGGLLNYTKEGGK